MTGPHVHGELDALLDGALDAVRRHAVEAHVAACAQCAAALERARRVAQAVADVPVPDPGDAYWARFADRVEARVEPRLSPRPETAPLYERLLRWLVPPGRWGWVGTASVLATATLVVYVGMRGYKPQPVSMPNRMERAQRPDGAPPQAPPAAPRPPAPFAAAPEPDRAMPAPEPPAGLAKPSARPVQVPPPVTPRPQGTAVRDAAAPVEPAPEQAQAEAAPDEERPARQAPDAVLEFANEFLLGSRQAAAARYAALVQDDLAAVPGPDRALVRSWETEGTAVLDPGPAPMPAGKARAERTLDAKDTARSKEDVRVFAAPSPQAQNDLLAEKQSAGAAEISVAAPPPSRAQLQILDALVWPRRNQTGARDAVAALTRAWQREAGADAHARARVRELAAWLADTSPASDEKAHWEAVRDGADDR